MAEALLLETISVFIPVVILPEDMFKNLAEVLPVFSVTPAALFISSVSNVSPPVRIIF